MQDHMRQLLKITDNGPWRRPYLGELFSLNRSAIPTWLVYWLLPYGLSHTVNLTFSILKVLFLLIGIANCSLLNPGPYTVTDNDSLNLSKDGLSCYYQNVPCLIPFTDLGQENPNLDYTKITKLQQYV